MLMHGPELRRSDLSFAVFLLEQGQISISRLILFKRFGQCLYGPVDLDLRAWPLRTE
jgi:hypothetical protein